MIFAETYKSNIMAQNLGPVDSDAEYVLDVGARETLLKHDGVVVKRFVSSKSGESETVTEEDLERGTERIKKYRNGLLVEEVYKTEERIQTIVLNYQDGSLLFATTTTEPNRNPGALKKNVKKTADGEKKTGSESLDTAGGTSPTDSNRKTETDLKTTPTDLQGAATPGVNTSATVTAFDPAASNTLDSSAKAGASEPATPGANKSATATASEPAADVASVTEYYLRNATTGALIGTRMYDSINFAGRTYLIEGDAVYRQYNENLVFRDNDTLSFNDDGSFSFSDNGVVYNYSRRGDLVSTEKAAEEGKSETAESVTYSYDDSHVLVSQETTRAGIRTVNTFEDGRIVRTENYKDGLLENTIRYNEEGYGSVKTVWSMGSPLADVYYGDDNIRIMKIEYL